mmetsp:Transcript_6178/g.17096  ORF Transcript_6178/g.17096 Transcript_6178/m.17096 type:complete len:457 (-) Transcript_6178:59-1429(-)
MVVILLVCISKSASMAFTWSRNRAWLAFRSASSTRGISARPSRKSCRKNRMAPCSSSTALSKSVCRTFPASMPSKSDLTAFLDVTSHNSSIVAFVASLSASHMRCSSWITARKAPRSLRRSSCPLASAVCFPANAATDARAFDNSSSSPSTRRCNGSRPSMARRSSSICDLKSVIPAPNSVVIFWTLARLTPPSPPLLGRLTLAPSVEGLREGRRLACTELPGGVGVQGSGGIPILGAADVPQSSAPATPQGSEPAAMATAVVAKESCKACVASLSSLVLKSISTSSSFSLSSDSPAKSHVCCSAASWCAAWRCSLSVRRSRRSTASSSSWRESACLEVAESDLMPLASALACQARWRSSACWCNCWASECLSCQRCSAICCALHASSSLVSFAPNLKSKDAKAAKRAAKSSCKGFAFVCHSTSGKSGSCNFNFTCALAVPSTPTSSAVSPSVTIP